MSNTTGMALQGTLNVLAGTTGLGADEAARRMVATAPYTGTGSPEGVVTATVGAKYIDSAATCGAVEWTKMSGSSNTGWVVTVGDTGWRAVTLLNSWTGDLRLRRLGQFVHVQGKITMGSSAVAYTFPTGFRVAQDSTWATTWACRDDTDGTVDFFVTPADHSLYGYTNTGHVYTTGFVTPTYDAWPTSLPGSAAYTP